MQVLEDPDAGTEALLMNNKTEGVRVRACIVQDYAWASANERMQASPSPKLVTLLAMLDLRSHREVHDHSLWPALTPWCRSGAHVHPLQANSEGSGAHVCHPPGLHQKGGEGDQQEIL